MNIVERRLSNPLTHLELLDFLVPGATLLLSIYCFEFWIHQTSEIGVIPELRTPLFTIVTAFGERLGANWVLSFLFLMVLLAIAFAVGHIVSTISWFALDRVLIGKGYGYPYERLLGLSHRQRLSNHYYRSLFFWVNLYLLLRYAYHLTNESYRVVLVPITEIVAWGLIAVTVVKMVFSESYSVRPNWLGRKLKSSFGTKATRHVETVFKVLALPYNAIANLLASFVGTREPLPITVRKSYKRAFKELFELDSAYAGSNNFWFPYLYVRDHDGALSRLVQQREHSCLFARSLSTALYLAFLYCMISILWQAGRIDQWSVYYVKALVVAPWILFIAAFALLSRFYHTFATSFTKNMFRAFLVIRNEEAELAKVENPSPGMQGD